MPTRSSPALAPLFALTACATESSAPPSFQDVLPILAANCLRCHAYPVIGGAPAGCTADASGTRWCGFRLDSYDDLVVDQGDPADPTDDLGVRGAASIAAIIPSRVRDPRRPMPPRFPLEDAERDMLVAWARGEPPSRDARPGNLAPTIELEVSPAGQRVTIAYALHDPDGDLVVGTLRARRDGSAERLVAPLQSGRDSIVWDTTGVAVGEYALSAWVDDGGGWRELDAGTVVVGQP